MTAASVTIQRRVQWMDTDAAGIWHHSVVLRWAEEAEAELHRQLGIIGFTFGVTPRVKTGFEFANAVRFDDVVDITLSVDHLGTTSMAYRIEVKSGAKEVAKGRVVIVFVDSETGEKKPWPEEVRTALDATS